MSDLILKEIPDFPGYKAGSDGHIYSYRKPKIGGYDYNKIPLKLKGTPDGSKNYLLVSICLDRKVYKRTIHRLICKTFHGIPMNNQEASHINGNSTDNRPENLKWEYPKENSFRRKIHGTDNAGIKNYNATFTEDQLLKVRQLLKQGIKQAEIARMFNCNASIISYINTGKKYKTQGM